MKTTILTRLRAAFLGSVCAIAMLAVVAVPCAILTSCTQSQRNTAATLTTTLTQAAAQVASLQGNTELAAKLKVDGAAVATALTNFQQTNSGADAAIQVITILEDDLGLIPETGPYAPLIQIALATAQTLIALIPQSAVSPAVAQTMQAHRMKAVYLGHPAPQSADDFKKQWNDVVKANPQLAGAAIK
jgi:hypothetical protein